MKNYLTHILGSVAVFVLLFSAAWTTFDISDTIIHDGLKQVQAAISCGGCTHNNYGIDYALPSGGGFAGFGGGGEIGGGGLGAKIDSFLDKPACTVDLTKNKISWTATNATSVTFSSSTNSPSVPGATGSIAHTPQTVYYNGDFGAFKAQYTAKFEKDAQDTTGISLYVPGESHLYSFRATKATANRLCSIVFPGSVNGTFQTDTFKSPENNNVADWNGSTWVILPGKNYDPHLRYNFTCVSPTSSSGNALSGSYTFNPPLSSGTHTYTLTATGPGGSKSCTATVIVPPPVTPPSPTCALAATTSGSSVTLLWTTTNASSGSINQGVGTMVPIALGSKTVTQTGTKTYTATVTGPGGTATCSKKVTVVPPPSLSCDIFGTSLPVGAGNPTTLHYASVSATSFTVNNGVGALTPVNDGTFVVYPTATTTYTGTVTSSYGTATCSWTIAVTTTPPPPSAPSCDIFGPTTSGAGNPVTLHYASVNGTSFTVNNGVGALTPVNDGTFVVYPATTTTYTGTVSGPGGTATCPWTVTVVPPSAPTCTLSASPTSITSGDYSTLSWTLDNVVSFSIDNGVGAVTPTDTGSVDTPTLTTTTTFTGTALGSNGDTVTCSASVGVLPGGGPTPQCTLSVSDSHIDTGESIALTWTSANVTLGSIDHGVGTTSPVSGGTISGIYPSDDTTYTATFTGPYGTISCSAAVDVDLGGGGCTGNCGGGLNQPNVSLAKIQQPGEQPFAFVSLSQVPYTGFEAGPLLTMLFWTAVVLWSIGMTYVFMGKESMRLIASHVFSQGMTLVHTHTSDSEYDEYEDPAHFEAEHTVSAAVAAPASYAITPTVIAPPAPVLHAAEETPSLESLVELRAHASGVLLSPEARTLAASLAGTQEETLAQFGAVLDEAVRTIAREDGWIMLSADRLRAIHAVLGVEKGVQEKRVETPRAHAPVIDDSAVNRFVSALLSNDRTGAFALISALEHEAAPASRFATGVASLLDTLYRARLSGGVYPDLALGEKAAHLTPEALAKMVEVFAHALDTAYASQYTGLKIALAKAFDVE